MNYQKFHKTRWEREQERKREGRKLAQQSRFSAPLSGGLGRREFGACPDCGSCRWWDNRAAKVSGRFEKTAPDARCATCGYRFYMPSN